MTTRTERTHGNGGEKKRLLLKVISNSKCQNDFEWHRVMYTKYSRMFHTNRTYNVTFRRDWNIFHLIEMQHMVWVYNEIS